MVYVGIDPGVKTGIAYIKDNERVAKTLKIHDAIALVYALANFNEQVHIRVEDARKRKWFGPMSNAKKQGAGSVKRDCRIWEDVLKDLQKKSSAKISFQFVHPIKGGTKISKTLFQKLSGIQTVTSEHARDAYMLIHNFKFSRHELEKVL